MVGDGGLNITEGGKKEGRKGREGFVQDRCGWQREPEQHEGREGRKERKGEIDLFRTGMVGNGSLNSTEGGNGGRKEREGRICSCREENLFESLKADIGRCRRMQH